MDYFSFVEICHTLNEIFHQSSGLRLGKLDRFKEFFEFMI